MHAVPKTPNPWPAVRPDQHEAIAAAPKKSMSEGEESPDGIWRTGRKRSRKFCANPRRAGPQLLSRSTVRSISASTTLLPARVMCLAS